MSTLKAAAGRAPAPTGTDGVPGTVKMLRWPAQAELRFRYRRAGTPCLLVVEPTAAPPSTCVSTEDWVRAPISRDDLDARLISLWSRADQNNVPRLTPDGTLRFGGRSVGLSATQAELLDLFVPHFGRVVARDVLQERIADLTHERPTRNALDLHIMRLRRRIAPLGLLIDTAWGRGYRLDSGAQAAG